MDRDSRIIERMLAAGLRPTRQRLLLARLLFGHGYRHVTAEALYHEAMAEQGDVSLATVYNTLHQFTEAGLLREICVENGASFFDTNTTAHHHFWHEKTGQLTDIPTDSLSLSQLPMPPEGTAIRGVDVVIRVMDAL